MKERIDFAFQIAGLVVLCVGFALVGLFGLFDKTVLQMILVGMLGAGMLLVGAWTACREYLS